MIDFWKEFETERKLVVDGKDNNANNNNIEVTTTTTTTQDSDSKQLTENLSEASIKELLSARERNQLKRKAKGSKKLDQSSNDIARAVILN